MKRTDLALAALMAVGLNGAAFAAIEYDQNVTPDAIFGSGNANGSYTTDRANGVELGLRGKLRHNAAGAAENTFNSNGDGTYSFDAGVAPTQSFPTAVWSFEWSINTDQLGGTGWTLDDLSYELGLDTHACPGTDFSVVFDPIHAVNPGFGEVRWDHSMGDNSTANGAGVEPGGAGGSTAAYDAALGTYNVAQNSWKAHWFFGPGFDPTIDGTYDIYLLAKDGGGSELARTEIQIIVGDGVPDGADCQPPVVTDVLATPNPVAVQSVFDLTATASDASLGDSDIASASYSLGGDTGAMVATDGGFDSPTEAVEATPLAPYEAGIYDFCVNATDAAGNTGADECTGLVVYDPSAGFVTGGGWIMSPEGAMPPVPATISGISGSTTVDPAAAFAAYYLRYVGNPPPAGFDPSHNYQWAEPAVLTPSPEDGPVSLTGTIDIDDQAVGQVAMIGLLDHDDLAAGNSSFQRGAYIYIYRNSLTSWRIGPSDGNSAGEIVQTFVTVSDSDLPPDGVLNVVLTVDGTADGTLCASGPFAAPAGCITLQISGGTVNATLTDSYGDIIGNASATPEFANGSIPGWDDYVGSNVGYTLLVPTSAGSPAGKANFGFVSKYKKGASVPTGNTQFTFQAGDLSFHSDSYEWLVVTGSNYARFKGEGTVNGAGAPGGGLYKFMIWAGDATPDTFRIKIWYEDGGEVVVYDNGMDQAIGGGQIIIHTGKAK